MTYTEQHFKKLNILQLFCIIIIATTLIIITGMFINHLIKQQSDKLHNLNHVKFDQLKILDDTTIAINQLDIEKTGSNNVVYHLLAEYATKNTQNIITMQQIKLLYNTANSPELITVNAVTGQMDEHNKLIHLNGLINICFKDFTILTEEIKINFAQNIIEGNKNIRLTNQQYSFEADNFIATQDPQIIEFNGHIKAAINVSM